MNFRAALRQYPQANFALAYLALFVLGTVLGFFWLPYDPNSTVSADFWAGPSNAHLLGVDGSGRDVFSRLLAAGKVTLLVALVTAGAASLLSIVLAALTVKGPELLRNSWSVIIDVLIAFPTLIFAIMLATVFKSGLPIALVALSIGFGVSMSRIIRGELAQALELDYVTAARTAGVSEFKIFVRHALRAARPVLITQTALVAGLSILAESSLSYLGYGVPAETPSHGLMLAQSQQSISVYPLHTLWPGLTLMLFALSCFILGDVLRSASDPRTVVATKQRATALTDTVTTSHDPAAANPGVVTAKPGAPLTSTQNSDTTLLRLENFTVQTATGKVLLHPLSFTLQQGKTLGLIGASGSGKTITAQAIAGLLDDHLHTTGSLTLAGQETTNLPEKARAQLRGTKVGYIFQEPKTALSPLKKLGQQMVAPLAAHYNLSKQELRSEALRLAELVGLDSSLLARYPHEVSGGQRQRAAIAAALAADPQLLIADEVTSALDATVRGQILALLQRLVTEHGYSLIFISHDLNQVRHLCEQILVLDHGRQVEFGSAEAIYAEPKHATTAALLAAADGSTA